MKLTKQRLKEIIKEELGELKKETKLPSLYGYHEEHGIVKVPHRGSKSAPNIPVYDKEGQRHYVKYDRINYEHPSLRGLRRS